MNLAYERRTGLRLLPDCAPGAGSGHLRRSLVLGHAWQRAGEGICSLRVEGEVDSALEPVLAACAMPRGEPSVPGWTVLDSYRAALPDVGDLVIVDDFRQRDDHGSPIVVDQNFGADASLYPEADHVLLGPDFALLRPEFALARSARRPIEQAVRDVVISLGGVPSPTMLDGVVSTVRDRLPSATLHVLDGGRTDLATLFAHADLAISASGSTVWELLCCGVPTILLSVAENQERVRSHLVDAGHCWRGDTGSLAATLDTVTADASARSGRSIRGIDLVDGLGADRVVAQLRSFDIGLRSATMDDADALLAWANDPLTRSNSFNSASIDPVDHVNWLRGVVADAHSMLLVGEYDGGTIGQVRFDHHGSTVVVSVGLAPAARGQSLGAPLIAAGVRAARRRWPVTTIVARIKVDNTASVRAFRVGGFSDAAADAETGVVELRYP